MSNPPRCRTCGAEAVKCLGALADGSVFAGQMLQASLPGGRLWRCRRCGFVFRHPLLSDAQYEDLYRGGALGVWDLEKHRPDFSLVERAIAAVATEHFAVLDVGCYTGQFLASMPQSFELFGIEANQEAAAVAASKGVTIVADTVQALDASSRRYDAITACDVIEHVLDPLEFLRRLAGHLKPRGRLIITTGNCDAWLWRLSGAGFWYCHFPEHISFIGTQWIRRMPARAGLKLVSCTKFNYEDGFVRPVRIAVTALHRLSPALYRRLRARRGRVEVNQAPPGNGATRDHMMCIFEPS